MKKNKKNKMGLRINIDGYCDDDHHDDGNGFDRIEDTFVKDI